MKKIEKIRVNPIIVKNKYKFKMIIYEKYF